MADSMRSGTNEPDTARIPAFAAGLGLLAMAIAAPVVQFGVLGSLVVPGAASTTVANIAGSMGLFWAAIAVFAGVIALDVVIAWGFYRLLRPAGDHLALGVAAMRIVYAAIFAILLANLVHAAQVVGSASAADLESDRIGREVIASITSFNTGWEIALGVFGLHLVGLGVLLIRFRAHRVLAGLVVVAGAGYLVDALGRLVIADYAVKVSTYTFIGEALLIVWVLRRAVLMSRTAHPRPSALAAATADAVR